MFEDYLIDSHEFYLEGRNKQLISNNRIAKRFYRASVFYANGSIEAFVNQIAQSLKRTNTINEHIISYINDERLEFNPKTGDLRPRTEYHPLDEKIKVLVRSYDTSFDFNISSWASLQDFKKFRDSLVHPHEPEDEIDVQIYADKIKIGLKGIIEIMNRVSIIIYKKPLRKQLLDLTPE